MTIFFNVECAGSVFRYGGDQLGFFWAVMRIFCNVEYAARVFRYGGDILGQVRVVMSGFLMKRV